jgi:hypothetical protein
VGLRDRLGRLWGFAASDSHPDGLAELKVGDPAYDDWDVVEDFSELETARAFRQALTDRGAKAVLTADWPLDEYGRGDIALRVPPGSGPDAAEILDSDPD